MSVTHLFVSPKIDGSDDTIVQAGDWNDDHVHGTEAKNLVFAGPASGADAVPTFRSLVDADIPAAIARDSELHNEAHVLATTGPHTGTLPWTDLNKTGSSLADLATRAHSDLSDAPTSAHHTKYTDAEAVAALEAEATVSITGEWTFSDKVVIDGSDAADIQLLVQGAASQSDKIFEIQNSATAVKFSVDADGDTRVAGHMGIGPSGTVQSNRIMNVVELVADANLIGLNLQPTNTSSSGASRKTTGIFGIAEWKGTGTATGLECIALNFTARHNSARALTNLTAIEANLVSLVGGSGAITTGRGVHVPAPTWTGDVPANLRGIDIGDLVGNNAVTGETIAINIDRPVISSGSGPHYGIKIVPSSVGTVRPIWINSAGGSIPISGFDGQLIVDSNISLSTPTGGFSVMLYTKVDADTQSGPDGAILRVGSQAGNTTSVTSTANNQDIYGVLIDVALITDTGHTGVGGAMLGVFGQHSGAVAEPYAILESVTSGGINAFVHDTLIGGGTTAPYATYPGPLSGRLHVDQEATDGAKPAIFVDQRDVSEQGIIFSSSGSDININLFTVDVTGTPTLAWDESEDGFTLSKGLLLAGAFGAPITSISSQTTLDTTHHLVLCDASGGAFTVDLPAASGITGRIYHIKKTDSSANAVTVDGNASETIDGATTAALSAQYESIMISCDGSNWHII